MKILMVNACAMILVILLAPMGFAGPYAPAAGLPGSTAIHMNDTGLVSWATGWEDYSAGSDVSPDWQIPENALGKAVGTSYDIVSLGRGGSITMTFGRKIVNGDGWDFAVFENSVTDSFLELAYVEVSSNGVDFFRFENDSLTSSPVSPFGSVDPTDVTGFGGKYKQGYGTPFDLASLDGMSPLLDVNNIEYVRLLDIVGVGDGAYLDTSGDIIYDPYPTTGSAGFDLDAVGIINASSVPIPGAVWLLGSGLFGLMAIGRRRQSPNKGN
jgi:hypothetical protein